jgi:hypothetical protein
MKKMRRRRMNRRRERTTNWKLLKLKVSREQWIPLASSYGSQCGLYSIT